MASPLNPTSRTRSYQETATSNLRKILKKFSQDQGTIRRQQEIIRNLNESNTLKLLDMADKKIDEDIKNFDNNYYKPATTSLGSIDIRKMLDAQDELGRRPDGSFIYDDKMMSLVPEGRRNEFKTGQEIFDEYNIRIQNRKDYQLGEKTLRNVNVSNEEAIATFENLHKLHQQGFITESEFDEVYSLMEDREVPGYFTPEEVKATAGLTPNQAATNYGQLSYAYAQYRNNFVPSQENIEKYIPQDLQNLYERSKNPNYKPTKEQKDKLKDIDRFFNDAATIEANNLFNRLIAAEQTKKVYAAADEFTKGLMFAELGGLAIESIPELRDKERTELNNFLESEAGKDAKQKLINKLIDALGPVEGWSRFLDSKNRKHKLVLIEQ